ncbi:arrestin domain-containing protein 3 [Oryzias melastigma]|uniref:Arrestin domain-containing protein 3-like n=1 Tax=Oryzias melastigma TaxID=30732 RepID=A0A3B3BK32_ORYME|nr:arrestin domain-containing protein 3 [Oryzias melastigma]
MPSVESLTVNYDFLNEQGTFSEGDIVTGNVTLTLAKDTKVQSLFVKLKGDANVRWSEKRGDKTKVYSADTRYFKLKQFLTPEGSDETALPQGIHVYKFRFQIPPGSMPSSFKGSYGKIVYKIEAKLSRSWRMNDTAEKELVFISKFIPSLQSPMTPQSGSTRKEMGLFSKGHVEFEAVLNKKAFGAGENMELVLSVDNPSSKKVKPKLSLTKKITYYARGSTKSSTDEINKMVFDPIEQNTKKELKCVMEIPADQGPSIQNCDIIKLEYTLKVYLDISFAFDPEIIFPITILHSDVVSRFQHNVAAPSDFGGPSNSVFPPPAVSMGPYPVSPQAGGYGYPAAQGFSAPPPEYPGQPQPYAAPPGMYPPLPPTYEGYSNAVPQQPFPYGSGVSTSHLSPTGPPNHQPPSAPPMDPQSSSPSLAPPAYSSLPSAPLVNENFLSQGDKAPLE